MNSLNVKRTNMIINTSLKTLFAYMYLCKRIKSIKHMSKGEIFHKGAHQSELPMRRNFRHRAATHAMSFSPADNVAGAKETSQAEKLFRDHQKNAGKKTERHETRKNY